MNCIETSLKDCFVIEPRVFEDDRGYFFETYNQSKDPLSKIHEGWVQDNEAKSNKGVLRGLHFQKGDHAQAKLVRVVRGAVQDIVVDLRKNSPTFGQSYSILLDEQNKKQLFVPRGFAHGYLVLEDNTIFSYKCDNYYYPESEGGLFYDDSTVQSNWDMKSGLILSEKDQQLPQWDQCYKFDS